MDTYMETNGSAVHALMPQNSNLMPQSQGMMQAVIANELQQVQAQVMLAKQFPRDLRAARSTLTEVCGMKSMAEKAMYSFPRGGKKIEGPSIRLLEAVAQAYQNIFSTYRVIDSDDKQTTFEAYAWDLQNNVKYSMADVVPHVRDYKDGSSKALTDKRDIRELVGSIASRRIRKCLESVIPGYLLEEAKQLCYQTLMAQTKLSEKKPALIEAFKKHGVTVPDLEANIGHSFNNLTVEDCISLGMIFNSLEDGVTKKEDWFPARVAAEKQAKEREEKDQTELKKIKDMMTAKNREIEKLGGNTKEFLGMSITEAKKTEKKQDLEARLGLLTDYAQHLSNQAAVT